MQNSKVGRIQSCKRLDFVFAQVQLSQLGQVAQTLKSSDFVFPELKLFKFGVARKSLEFLDFVFDQRELKEIRNVDGCKFSEFVRVEIEFSERFPAFFDVEGFPVFNCIFLQI